MVAPIRVIHGSLDSASEGRCGANPEAIRQLREIDISRCHYHWPWAWRVDGKLNPGSAGNSSPVTRAYYALLMWRGALAGRAPASGLQSGAAAGRLCVDGFLAEGGALARVFLRSTELQMWPAPSCATPIVHATGRISQTWCRRGMRLRRSTGTRAAAACQLGIART